MTYGKVVKAVFLERPNRFIAKVLLCGKEEICHVKNTGRCKELLIKGATVFLEENENPARKTKYDLIAVYKGDKLINIDSAAPNKVMKEYIPKMFADVKLIRPEASFKNSRFDFYIEADGRKIWMEVKGVTLEKDGIAIFPDAPTQRGLKHVRELLQCKEEGFDAQIVFVVQMEDVQCFVPNEATDPVFSAALKEAKENGVNITALSCHVQCDSLYVNKEVDIKI